MNFWKEFDRLGTQGQLLGKELRMHNALPPYQLALHFRGCPEYKANMLTVQNHPCCYQQQSTNVQAETVWVKVPCSLATQPNPALREAFTWRHKLKLRGSRGNLPPMKTSRWVSLATPSSYFYSLYYCYLLHD